MSENLRMRREIMEAYRAYQEDPYEPLLLQNYVRLLSRYKTDPQTVELIKNMQRWSGSKIVYEYVPYRDGGPVFVGAQLQAPLRRRLDPESMGRFGDGYSGYYVSDHSGLHGSWASPEFVREDLKRDSVFWTEDASYVLVSSETWPYDRVPNDVSNFFDSPYHGEVNLLSINGSGEVRWVVEPRQVTGSSVFRNFDFSRATGQPTWTGDLAAALEFGLVQVSGGDVVVGVEVPAP